MKKNINRLLIFIILLFGSCSMTMPKFDQVAYEKAVSLKVDSLVLIEKSTDSYLSHQEEIADLKLRLQKAYEYAKGKPNNRIITKQWKIITDKNGHQIGGYLERWRAKEKLSKIFMMESSRLISKGFDQVIGLESGLIKGE